MHGASKYDRLAKAACIDAEMELVDVKNQFFHLAERYTSPLARVARVLSRCR